MIVRGAIIATQSGQCKCNEQSILVNVFVDGDGILAVLARVRVAVGVTMGLGANGDRLQHARRQRSVLPERYRTTAQNTSYRGKNESKNK